MLTRLMLQPGSDVDNDELDQLTIQLRGRLLDELDVEPANTGVKTGATPDGARSQSVTMFGTVALALSPITLRSVIQLIQAWITNRPVRTVKITIENDSIEISHMSTSDQRQLIEAFIDRHVTE